MPRTAVQLHTLRRLDEPISTKLDLVADAGYDGVQFTPALEDTPVETLVAELEDRNLGVAGSHVDLERLESMYDERTHLYRALGATDLVVSTYDREAFESEDGLDRVVDHLSALSERLAADGFDCHYHNHYFEFTDPDGATGYERFVERTEGSIRPEIDTGLAYHGGADPAALLERYGDRVDLVHLTDTIPGSNETAHTDLGEGEVDLQACVDAAVAADVEWLIYENGRTDDPPASIVDAADELSALLEP